MPIQSVLAHQQHVLNYSYHPLKLQPKLPGADLTPVCVKRAARQLSLIMQNQHVIKLWGAILH